LKFDIIDSSFDSNNGINGGVIYFGSNENENAKHDLNFINTSFVKNKSKYFGGVIYSKYKYLYTLKATNVMFKNNYAGVAGGVFFFQNFQNNPIDDKKCFFVNNNAELHGSNYATHPSLIKLNDINKFHHDDLKSGSHFPMEFIITDSFNNIIKDYNKYYDIYIKISLRRVDHSIIYDDDADNDDDDDRYNYILKGNICLYMNGKLINIINDISLL